MSSFWSLILTRFIILTHFFINKNDDFDPSIIEAGTNQVKKKRTIFIVVIQNLFGPDIKISTRTNEGQIN